MARVKRPNSCRGCLRWPATVSLTSMPRRQGARPGRRAVRLRRPPGSLRPCRSLCLYHVPARLPVASDSLVEANGAGGDETSVDLRGALEVLMARLSEQDQEALRAVDLDGFSQKEYADSLGLNYATAKSRVQRARKRLRREFERCCTVVLDRRGTPLACTPRHQSVCCEAC